MQARFAAFSAIALVLAAAPASASEAGACPEQPVCGYCGADIDVAEEPNATASGGGEVAHDVFVTEAAVGGANGGVWKTQDGGLAPSAPLDVQTAPSANMPVFLELDGVPGEGSEAPSSPPPPPPPPPKPPSSSGGSLPMEEIAFNFTKVTSSEAGVQDFAAPHVEQAALLVPAVQKVRDAAARAGEPQMDGVVLLNQEEEQARGAGTLTLTNGNAAAQPQQQQQEGETEERERPRRNFSLTIGGVTVGTGGVNVAVGDVTGDGAGESRARRPARGDRAGSAPSRR